MELKVGTRWRSAVCETEVVIVRTPGCDVSLRCGGHPMIAPQDELPDGAVLDPRFAGGSRLGKRFVAADLGLEVLVVKAGEGTLSSGDQELQVKDAKPLPASD